MASHKVYLRKEFESQIQAEADKLGVSANDLIKSRLEISLKNEHINQKILDRVEAVESSNKNLQICILQMIRLLESNLTDTAYIRGIHEAVTKDKKAAIKGEELENCRLQSVNRIKEEVAKYL